MTIIVDRFEGDHAIVEFEGTTFSLPRSLLPEETREGNILRLSIEIDHSATTDWRVKVKSLEDRLFRK